MSGCTVGSAGPDDIGAFVASVEGLFREDGGRHDPSIDVAWPTREGLSYCAGLLGDRTACSSSPAGTRTWPVTWSASSSGPTLFA